MSPLPYHVYLDLDVCNNDFASDTPPKLRFEETRNHPFWTATALATSVRS